MQGYICGIADNSRINYCPLCRAALKTNAYYGDGTVVCDECDFYFAVIECEEKEHDEDLQNHEREMLDEEYDLCDECIEKLYDWLKDN